jgi:hypothetical protein
VGRSRAYVSGTKGKPTQKNNAGMNWTATESRHPSKVPVVVVQCETIYPTLEKFKYQLSSENQSPQK